MLKERILSPLDINARPICKGELYPHWFGHKVLIQDTEEHVLTHYTGRLIQ